MIGLNKRRYFIIIILLILIGFLVRFLFYHVLLSEAQDYQHKPGSPVIITVFYETLCPDSKHFILKQLIPAYKKASPLMEIQFVVYGKAKTIVNPDGSYRFDCQHGDTECQGNIYHACAAEAIVNPVTRLEVIGCMIKDNRLPKEAMHKCAHQYNIEHIDLIQKCVDSSHGPELLKLNGDTTHALRPKVSFIPTITLDGSQGRQPSILKNLLAEICKIVGDTDEAAKICKNP